MGAGSLSSKIIDAERDRVKYEGAALRKQLKTERELISELSEQATLDIDNLGSQYAGQTGSAVFPSVKTITKQTDFKPLLLIGGLILLLKGFK